MDIKIKTDLMNQLILPSNFPHCPICSSSKIKQLVYEPHPKDINRKKYYLVTHEKQGDSFDWWCKNCGCEWRIGFNLPVQVEDIIEIYFESGREGIEPKARFKIDLRNKTISWNEAMDLVFDTFLHQKVMAKDDWEKILADLRTMDIFHWKWFYDNKLMMHGYSWSIEIKTADVLITKHGSNQQPSGWFLLHRLLKLHTGQEIMY